MDFEALKYFCTSMLQVSLPGLFTYPEIIWVKFECVTFTICHLLYLNLQLDFTCSSLIFYWLFYNLTRFILTSIHEIHSIYPDLLGSTWKPDIYTHRMICPKTKCNVILKHSDYFKSSLIISSNFNVLN